MSTNIIPSHSFSSISRQRPPAWSNRIRKDVNDLMYHPKDLRDIQYMKKNKYRSKSIVNIQGNSNFSPIKKAIDKYQSNSKDNQLNLMKKSSSTNKVSGEVDSPKVRNFSKNFSKDFSLKDENPESFNLKKRLSNNEIVLNSTDHSLQRNNSESSLSARVQSKNIESRYGLSGFEFSTKTIQGKITSKNYHNLDLSKSKTQKLSFEYPIFYDKSQDIKFDKLQRRKLIEALGKQRNFKNYQPHYLYSNKKEPGNGGSLDKFYDIEQKKLDYVKKKTNVWLNLQKITPRPGIPKKLGTNLEYQNVYTQIVKSNTHRLLYEIQTVERRLIVPRQVITDTKGTYR